MMLIKRYSIPCVQTKDKGLVDSVYTALSNSVVTTNLILSCDSKINSKID